MKNIFLLLLVLLLASSCGMTSSQDSPSGRAESYVNACLQCDLDAARSLASGPLRDSLADAFGAIEEADSLTRAGVGTILSSMSVRNSSETRLSKDSVLVRIAFGDSVSVRNVELMMVRHSKGWMVADSKEVSE